MSNSTLTLSSFLNRESDEVTEAIVGIPVFIGKVKIPTPPPPTYLCLELYLDNEDEGVRIECVQLYENGVLAQEAKLCLSCLTETSDRDGCICSLPKGYCWECGDTKCNRFHADEMERFPLKRRGRKVKKN
jgi:hypothetical protein